MTGDGVAVSEAGRIDSRAFTSAVDNFLFWVERFRVCRRDFVARLRENQPIFPRVACETEKEIRDSIALPKHFLSVSPLL